MCGLQRCNAFSETVCSLQIIKLDVKRDEVYRGIMTPLGLVHGSNTPRTLGVMGSHLFALLIPRFSLAYYETNRA